ncbi:MAG: hypothetical protein ACR2O1_17085 [Boseongicola sp.]
MRKLISGQDIRLAIYLPLFFLLAWLLPHSRWNGVAKWLAELPQPFAPFRVRRDASTRTRRLRPIDRATQKVLRQFQYLRELRPGGWHPEIIIENKEIALEVVAEGNGAVFWIVNTRCADLIAKKALHRIGLELHHLSRPEHGGSQSAFGKRYLNALPRLAENQYLKERVLITTGKELSATRRLKEILSTGRAVSITASSEGRQTRLVRIFDGVLPLATGAPALATATDAALIPIVCIQLPNSAPTFRVTVVPRISIDVAETRQLANEHAFGHFAAIHQSLLSQHASQWRGFGYMLPPGQVDESTAVIEPIVPP